MMITPKYKCSNLNTVNWLKSKLRASYQSFFTDKLTSLDNNMVKIFYKIPLKIRLAPSSCKT